MSDAVLNIRDFQSLLDESVSVHGHLCPGQVLGVKMSVAGLDAIGISDPKGKDRKNLIVFVEMDRCATDAVQSVTGCSLGKRTLKFMDYGKMAATFLNLKTDRAIRVVALEESREKAKDYFPDIEDKYAAQLKAYMVMPDEELFRMHEVGISLRHEDMPGRPSGRVRCEGCGEYVQDKREVLRNGVALCRPCAGGAYYIDPDRKVLSSVMQNCHSGLGIRSKLWIEVDGDPVFGRGRRLLLEAIDRYGSINQAAKEINISYRKAWGYIKAMEERLGIQLIERKTGGRYGGGASLTDAARGFIRKYRELEEGINGIVDERFENVFGVRQ